MQTEVVTDVKAPAETVWRILTDVERWPEWTASIESLELLGDNTLGPGSRARIKQPRVPAVEWGVTDFQPGHSFVWESSSMGVHSVARHELRNVGNGVTNVRLSVTQTGLLATILSPYLKRVSRRYLEMEVAGLTGRSESGSDAPSTS